MLDAIVVGAIVLVAVGYLAWKLAPTGSHARMRSKTACSACDTCGGCGERRARGR